MLYLLVVVLQPFNQLQTIVVFVLHKRPLCNAKIKFFESCLSDDFPKTFVRILFYELDGFLETYSGKQVACVSQALLVVHNKHFLNVLDLLGVLQHVIQEHALNLQISEVANVTGRKNRFFWFKVSEDKQTILLHKSTQCWIVRRPLDGPHFLAFNGQVRALTVGTTVGIVQVVEREDAVDVYDRELG